MEHIFFDDPIEYKGLVYLHEFYMRECLILMVYDTCYMIHVNRYTWIQKESGLPTNMFCRDKLVVSFR